MTKLLFTVVLLAFLNGCSMAPRVAPVVTGPGSTAFSSGYSGYSGSSTPDSSQDVHWGGVILGLGFLTALLGGCFALSDHDEMCFSILEGILAH